MGSSSARLGGLLQPTPSLPMVGRQNVGSPCGVSCCFPHRALWTCGVSSFEGSKKDGPPRHMPILSQKCHCASANGFPQCKRCGVRPRSPRRSSQWAWALFGSPGFASKRGRSAGEARAPKSLGPPARCPLTPFFGEGIFNQSSPMPDGGLPFRIHGLPCREHVPLKGPSGSMFVGGSQKN